MKYVMISYLKINSYNCSNRRNSTHPFPLLTPLFPPILPLLDHPILSPPLSLLFYSPFFLLFNTLPPFPAILFPSLFPPISSPTSLSFHSLLPSYFIPYFPLISSPTSLLFYSLLPFYFIPYFPPILSHTSLLFHPLLPSY